MVRTIFPSLFAWHFPKTEFGSLALLPALHRRTSNRNLITLWDEIIIAENDVQRKGRNGHRFNLGPKSPIGYAMKLFFNFN